MTVRARYSDASQQEHIGQTVACTDLGGRFTVGDTVPLYYRAAAPEDILLAKDRGVYIGLADLVAVLIALAVAGILVVVVPWRTKPAGPDFGAFAMPRMMVNDPRQRVLELSQEAIGPSNYATRQIGLKEALLLLHLRHTDDQPSDDPRTRANPTLLRDHLVLAAMLMDLVARRHIEVRGSGRLWAHFSIYVIDSTPPGEPDLDELLATLRATPGRIGLRSFYFSYSRRHLTARLIDQMRQGGYLRLHEPTTGRFASWKPGPSSMLGQFLVRILAPYGFNTGYLVVAGDYHAALPWQFLYTTHTAAEDSMFQRVQAAIANRGVTDDFTRNLLTLVAAHYIAPRAFPRRTYAQKSLYRFYPPEERKGVVALVRRLAAQAPPGELAIYRLARRIDDRIENPPAS